MTARGEETKPVPHMQGTPDEACRHAKASACMRSDFGRQMRFHLHCMRRTHPQGRRSNLQGESSDRAESPSICCGFGNAVLQPRTASPVREWRNPKCLLEGCSTASFDAIRCCSPCCAALHIQLCRAAAALLKCRTPSARSSHCAAVGWYHQNCFCQDSLRGSDKNCAASVGRGIAVDTSAQPVMLQPRPLPESGRKVDNGKTTPTHGMPDAIGGTLRSSTVLSPVGRERRSSLLLTDFTCTHEECCFKMDVVVEPS